MTAREVLRGCLSRLLRVAEARLFSLERCGRAAGSPQPVRWIMARECDGSGARITGQNLQDQTPDAPSDGRPRWPQFQAPCVRRASICLRFIALDLSARTGLSGARILAAHPSEAFFATLRGTSAPQIGHSPSFRARPPAGSSTTSGSSASGGARGSRFRPGSRRRAGSGRRWSPGTRCGRMANWLLSSLIRFIARATKRAWLEK
jgi:hypothetical protein